MTDSDDAIECANTLRLECYRVLDGLAQYVYDPE